MIEGFETFCRKEESGTKTSYVRWDVDQEVKFCLCDEDAGSALYTDTKKIINRSRKICLS